jgi:hypothetical protein
MNSNYTEAQNSSVILNSVGVLLYSQYSSHCKNLIDLVQKYSIDFGLTNICIDNEKIRNQIMSSKKITIECVPCILIYFADGVVEKYDGSNAFRYIEDLITKSLPPPPPLPVSVPLPVPVNNQNDWNDEENFEQIDISPPKTRPKKPKSTQKNSRRAPTNDNEEEQLISSAPPRKTAKNVKTPTATSIEDIETDEDAYEEQKEYKIKKPVSVMRTDAGNYEIDPDFGNDAESPKRDVKRGIKSSTQIGGSSASKSDILSAAQTMQQLREREDDELHPHKLSES